ncbi:MAG TPA: hypothetical protein VM779_04190 [Thermoanaerobaculia bacterium]|nr:hypothetical protein [Thermoanaerobaculia bacterium]
MKLTSLAVITVLMAAPAAFADCDQTAPHRLTANLDGASRITIIGRAGSLRVEGANQGVATARGTACASDRDFLDRMRIEARRDGSDVVIEAIIPERMVFGFHSARLDFEVVVPENMPVRVKDGSGSVEIRNIASLDITDGSGDMEIRGVRGDVTIRDGSGAIKVRDVGGDVEVHDGSGSITIVEVRGGVRIVSDGSGGIDIRDVQRDVIVENDGSGGIDVRDVRGNFIVERKGSGRIDYDNIGGTVRIPAHKR